LRKPAQPAALEQEMQNGRDRLLEIPPWNGDARQIDDPD